MKTALLLSLFAAALSAHAQDTHSFTFTGQQVEAFNLTGMVREAYNGTCYEHEQWETQDCNYNDYGEYRCQTVAHGSATPYDCIQYRYVPGTGARAVMPTRILFNSTLRNPRIAFDVSLDDKGAPLIKAKGLLPAGTVMGVKQGERTVRPDTSFAHESQVRLTTNDALQADLITQVRQVRLDMKNRRLVARLVGNVTRTDALNFVLKTADRTFSRGRRILSFSGTLDRLSAPSEARMVAPNEMEVEVDLIPLLREQTLSSATLEVTHTKTMDPAFTWSGVIGRLVKSVSGSVRVTR